MVNPVSLVWSTCQVNPVNLTKRLEVSLVNPLVNPVSSVNPTKRLEVSLVNLSGQSGQFGQSDKKVRG